MNVKKGGPLMDKISRRDFLGKAGKTTLAFGTLSVLGSGLLGRIPFMPSLAIAGKPKPEFDVYNDINPNAKDIVAHTFKDCLVKKWWPGICYKTDKPMVAVAAGTVTEIFNTSDTTGYLYQTIRKEQNQSKGFGVTVTTGNNYNSFYLHLTTPEVEFGQKITRGQLIGYPDERWNMPRLVVNEAVDQIDPNNYGVNHSYMNYWDGKTDLDIGKEEQNKRYEIQQQILNKFAGMAEGPEEYTLLRKKHEGMQLSKWSPIEYLRYIEYLHQNKPETFPSLTKEQFGEMKKEFYSNQPIIFTLPFS
jgi:hypothetical protein